MSSRSRLPGRGSEVFKLVFEKLMSTGSIKLSLKLREMSKVARKQLNESAGSKLANLSCHPSRHLMLGHTSS
jgi:hypothetical protein